MILLRGTKSVKLCTSLKLWTKMNIIIKLKAMKSNISDENWENNNFIAYSKVVQLSNLANKKKWDVLKKS